MLNFWGKKEDLQGTFTLLAGRIGFDLLCEGLRRTVTSMDLILWPEERGGGVDVDD